MVDEDEDTDKDEAVKSAHDELPFLQNVLVPPH
jgi:hypothetical protein